MLSPWPQYDKEVEDAVVTVLRSGKINYWTGTEVKIFENEFARWVGTEYALALANGTVAIELALRAIDLKEGDEVIVTPRSFVASASTIVIAGGVPVFCDVDKNSQNITVETIRPKITPKTKAIICVHLAGFPCDMDPIMELAKEKDIYVIEDCAQAHGAKYKGRMVGSIGDIGCWSFCQDKIMSTGGEGGMLTLNDRTLYRKAWSYKDHGKDFNLMRIPHNGTFFKFVHRTIGSNYRMTEMQGAIGRTLLKRVDEWVDIRRRNANILYEALCDLHLVRTPQMDSNIYHSFYKYYVFINPEMLAEGWERSKILKEMVKVGAPVYTGSCSEIYLEECFNGFSVSREDFPNAKLLGETSLMFLVHPTINVDEMREYANRCRIVLLNATAPYFKFQSNPVKEE